MNLGSGFTFEVELATVFCAIELAQAKGWTKVWLECDSVYVVQIFRSQTSNISWRALAQWHKIRQLIQNMYLVVWCLIYTEKEMQRRTDLLEKR
ncbi:hypothetical protein ACS0TY_005975 [Phlomoides rotata]